MKELWPLEENKYIVLLNGETMDSLKNNLGVHWLELSL